jgi:hypothetical protein
VTLLLAALLTMSLGCLTYLVLQDAPQLLQDAVTPQSRGLRSTTCTVQAVMRVSHADVHADRMLLSMLA